MFNKSQIQAISHMDGPAMVLAGPGSGKTTVITHRIKNLIEKAEVRPENILVVTFTKAAAISMQKRFSTLMNGGKGQLVTFGTFHSVFYKILRKSRRYEATEILSERQKTDYIREIIGRYGISSNDISELSQNIINDIGNIKGNMLNAQEYEPSCCKKEDFIKVYNAYNLELKKDGKMDFDDILRECYLLLCENHTILEQWRELYKYILIDEFQDINRIQMNIIELLASPLNNIFVVGDDDQSIYGFRGARPEIMIEFKDYYPEAELIVLDVNYRSTQSIINVAGRVIENNKTRLDKCAHANNNKDFQPDIRKFRNQVEELKFVVSKIKEYENQGISLSEMAILVRNNSQVQEISSFLKNRKIEAESGKHRSNIYNGMVAKDILYAAWNCVDQGKREQLLLENCTVLDANDFEQLFGEIGGSYTELTDRTRRHEVTLLAIPQNKLLAERLQAVGYITSWEERSEKFYDPVFENEKNRETLKLRIKQVK